MNYYKIQLVKLIIKFCYQQRKTPLKVVDLPNYVSVLFPGPVSWFGLFALVPSSP